MPANKRGKDLRASGADQVVGTYVKRETPPELPSE